MSFPALGVVIVSFNATDVILDCLDSLLAASDVVLHIVVVDNASTDGSADLIRTWAAGQAGTRQTPDLPFPVPHRKEALPLYDRVPDTSEHSTVTLLEAGVNGGFAAGVNIGLAALHQIPTLDRFWVLNPDCIVPPQTPAHFATYQPPGGQFSLMGGRVRYIHDPDQLQSDGGVVNRRSGVTSNVNRGCSHAHTPRPDPGSLDFVSGANMVASRAFYDRVGPLPEDYFLYYEEVDWALRRGDMPLAVCPEAEVFHHTGTSIGSATSAKIGSPFAVYFMYRSRMRFVRHHSPRWQSYARAYALAKAGQLLIKGHYRHAGAIWAAVCGTPVPADIRARLSPQAAERAFSNLSGT